MIKVLPGFRRRPDPRYQAIRFEPTRHASVALAVVHDRQSPTLPQGNTCAGFACPCGSFSKGTLHAYGDDAVIDGWATPKAERCLSV